MRQTSYFVKNEALQTLFRRFLIQGAADPELAAQLAGEIEAMHNTQ
jgi:hypothetical protein